MRKGSRTNRRIAKSYIKKPHYAPICSRLSTLIVKAAKESSMGKYEVRINEKICLTLEEAAAYSGIGINRLRDLSNDPKCDFVLFVGTKRLIKRRQFEKFLESVCVL